jgi:hypothetical protein
MGDGRTVLHDTKVGEFWGHNVKKWPHLVFHRAHRNARGLIEAGQDPLRVLCERAHNKGMKFYATLLLQQGAGTRGKDTRSSDFRFDNRHLEIGARGDLDPEFPGLTLLDFKHDEVREERLALIRETLNRYPVDGLELQLNYGLHHFHPEEVEKGRGIMTRWVESVHRTVKQSGADRNLIIRVPSSIDGCDSIGLDIREWIRRAIVDVIVGQSFSGPETLDQMADFRPLVRAAAGSSSRIFAAVHSRVDSDRVGEAAIEMLRAAACNYWEQGVDGLYLAHWFGNWPYKASFYEKLRELCDPEIMAPKDKIYFVPNRGRGLEPGLRLHLPVELRLNEPVLVPMTISDDLPRWDEAGRVHDVMLRLRIMNTTELDRLEIRLNGEVLPDLLRRKINQMYRMRGPRYRTGPAYWYVFHLDGPHWPRKGENRVQITLKGRDPDVTPGVSVRDVEMEIRYLMGKNFHRDHEPDLGPAVRTGI